MAYYVLGPGGAKHGPAELHTLNDWIAQGRIVPETLIEDMGGTKVPARAIRGLTFAGGVPDQQPIVPARTQLGTPSVPPVPQQINTTSNYLRPGLGTGGSDANLFLPAAHSQWATQGFLSAAGGVLLGVVVMLVERNFHFEFGRLTFLALGLPIFGVRSGYIGLNRGERGRATLVILANVFAFASVLGAIILGFSLW